MTPEVPIRPPTHIMHKNRPLWVHDDPYTPEHAFATTLKALAFPVKLRPIDTAQTANEGGKSFLLAYDAYTAENVSFLYGRFRPSNVYRLIRFIDRSRAVVFRYRLTGHYGTVTDERQKTLIAEEAEYLIGVPSVILERAFISACDQAPQKGMTTPSQRPSYLKAVLADDKNFYEALTAGEEPVPPLTPEDILAMTTTKLTQILSENPDLDPRKK